MTTALEKVLAISCLVAALCAPAALRAAADDPLAAARARFEDARKALNDHRKDDYRKLARKLKDYPLYPYLEYWELNDRLSSAGNREVSAFLKNYADQPVGIRLRRAWLYQLARRQDWKHYLDAYEGGQPVELQCYRLQAKLHTDDTATLVDAALPLWLVGYSQDSACDPVFDYLEQQGKITDDLVWERIRLAMNNGNASLATWLAKRLPTADQDWVTLWREARQRPAETLDDPQLRRDTPIAREIVLYAIRRIAGSDEQQARDRWQSVRTRYDFSAEDAGRMERTLALYAGWRQHPQAHAWLEAVPAAAVDSEVREWRARSAIAAGLWLDVLKHIAAMPPAEAQAEEWRYWEAVALEHTGQKQAAQDRLAPLARERDYHGFLAADALRWPYVMNNQPLDFNRDELDSIRALPGMVRARELLLVDLPTDARREWLHVIEGFDATRLKLAAVLASEWGWHDSAILTVARSSDYDDLQLRFPIDHGEDVERYASANRLDPGHVFAVIRTESAFNKDARSGAGAMGLMQLMPATGRSTARKYRIPLASTKSLYEPEQNIRIGTAYLKQVMEQYDDNVVLASAAYNAGPQRVNRWLPEEHERPAENWVAAIPFDETRKYVQRILSYAAIYDWRLDRPITPLSEHMPDVKPKEQYDKGDGR
ncbi:MAG: transglycosylase SLT domain-containing protein [Pseudomonadota bacterium]